MWTEESFWETVLIYHLKINICKIKSKSWKQRAEICHTRFIKHAWGNMTAERFQASPHKERFNNNTFLITSCDACWEQNARLWVLLFPSLRRLSGLLSALNHWKKDTVSFFLKGVTVTSDIFTSVNSINGVLRRSAMRALPCALCWANGTPAVTKQTNENGSQAPKASHLVGKSLRAPSALRESQLCPRVCDVQA